MAEATHEKEQDSIPFYPDHVRTEARVTLGVLIVAGIVGVIGLLRPVGLGAPADPMMTPAHTKPEWYFLGLYQILKFVPETVGVMLPILGVLFVLLWPFFDRKPNSARAQRIRLIVSIVALVVAVILTIWGEVS
jgi:quinol-cytochrome oxidoreductase complex cytochrome b subunit